MLSVNDVRRLIIAKTARVKELLPAAHNCLIVFIDGDPCGNSEAASPELRICCQTALEVEDILGEPFDLVETAHLVAGVNYASVWFAGEEVWGGFYRQPTEGGIESGLLDLEFATMPATLERPVTAQNGATNPTDPRFTLSNALPAVSIDDLVLDLNIEPNLVINWLQNQPGVEVWDFQGALLVSGLTARATYQHFWTESLEAVLARRGLSTTPAAPTAPTEAAPVAEVPQEKPRNKGGRPTKPTTATASKTAAKPGRKPRAKTTAKK